MGRFNHAAAVAAARKCAVELQQRLLDLTLARVATIGRADDLGRIEMERIRYRVRSLHEFIDDPWRSDSLLRLACDGDRRLVIDAGSSGEPAILWAPDA
jgi:hypothetical protein